MTKKQKIPRKPPGPAPEVFKIEGHWKNASVSWSPGNALWAVAQGKEKQRIMKRRHAAALALVGWYLMVPPAIMNSEGRYTEIDATAALSHWKILGSFDSASQCEALRTELPKPDFQLRALEGLLRSSKQHNSFEATAGRDSLQYLTDAYATGGSCVSTGDPPLKGN